MRVQRVRNLALLVVLAVIGNGCAVQRARAPQISEVTAWELNTAVLLSDLQRDYVDFFTRAGEWRRSNQITEDQLNSLNAIGNRLKPLLESAATLFQEYQRTHDADIRLQVLRAIDRALTIVNELAAARARLVVGGA